MKAEEKIITQMDIISKEVYDDGEDKQYFRQNPKNMVVDGVLYRVIDYVDKRTDMQALLLERGETNNNDNFKGSGEHVLAFRGTKGWVDIGVDGIIGLANINIQYCHAEDFTQKALTKISKDKDCSIEGAKSYLTLTGHSLGGIL